MPIPKTRKELIQQSQDNYDKLNELINAFSDEQRHAEFLPGTMNRNIRDVLAHLYHWHIMLLDWYNIGMTGEQPEMPAKGYSWKDTKRLNRDIWQMYQGHSLEEIRASLNQTHLKLQAIIEEHTDEELFEKSRYSWTGTSSVATYIRSNTLSHYKWALQLIKKGLSR